MNKKVLETLKNTFGYDSLYPTQENAIKSVLKGEDTFVLMPTGGGKSLCYQLPALMMDGVTIVVSPLISLMKDQVDSLKVNGVAAEYLNSSQDVQTQNEVKEKLKNGEIKILYISVERLISTNFSKVLSSIKVSLFAIDEAHCISAWGHDFRPEYTQLSHLKNKYPKTPIIALTATADQHTRDDIITQLEINNCNQFVDSFDRPNISLSVLPAKNRIKHVINFIQDNQDQPGIIYCLSRNQTEKLALKLQTQGITAKYYHAGMSSDQREKAQQSFVRDKTQVICATIAFGMGIDKSNVRWVIHYNLPKNIEGYYQEIGRAGRDGAPAQALLFYTYKDVETLKKFVISSSQNSLQLNKLKRIKEYSEAVICRRKILLNYFGEKYSKNCGNCDICEHPPQYLDGSTLANHILSTIDKDSNQLDDNHLVNLIRKKTTKHGFAALHFYLAQLINLGLVKRNPIPNFYLELTPQGRSILKNKKSKVKLVKLEDFITSQEKLNKTKKANKPAKEYFRNQLFEILRTVRLDIAKKENLPAYMIFSDKTLLEMAHEKPTSETEMKNITGVGDAKWEKYGSQFIDVIKRNS